MATMTTTPTGPARTAGAASGSTTGTTGGGGDAATDTGFGDLLAALVPGSPAGLAPASSTPPGVCGAGPEVIVSPEDVVVGATDSGQVVVGAAGDDTAGSRTGDPGAAATAEEAEPAPDPTAVVGAALLAQAQLAALPLLAPATAVPVATAATTDAPVEGADAVGTTADAGRPAETVAAPPAATTTDTSADGGTGSSPDQPAPAPTAATAPTAPVATPAAPAVDATAAAALAPTAATAATAPTATAARGEARPADAVPGQVFPEVVRLSQSGPGTHRVTLRLDPGTLGEVRVTLTVREGEVQVRLSAQHDAREVLAQAAPDLRRLLEQSGGVDARVAVADLATGTTTDLTGDRPYGGRGSGTDADPDQPASYDGRERETPRSRADADRLAVGERVREARPRSGLDLAL